MEANERVKAYRNNSKRFHEERSQDKTKKVIQETHTRDISYWNDCNQTEKDFIQELSALRILDQVPEELHP